MMAPRFAGRRAVVTGASRGIGAAVAERLVAEGADVAIVARTQDHHPTLPGSLEETRTRLATYGRRVAVIVADLADEAARQRIIPDAVANLDGPIDILVNNAAAAMYQPLATYPLRRRRVTFEVNVHAPLDLAQAVVPAMRDRGEGWIVNLSSASAGLTPGPPYPVDGVGATIGVYGASKAALDRLSNALAVELWGTGVRVNTVEPRAAVMSPGARVLVGDVVTDDMLEPMETIVEATVALCDCEVSRTGRIEISSNLIEELGLTVMALDGARPAADG